MVKAQVKLKLLLLSPAFLSRLCGRTAHAERATRLLLNRINPSRSQEPWQKPQAIPQSHPQAQSPSREVFIVKPGDTLYSIGFGSGHGYQLLSEWNNIPKPYQLRVGQEIKLYNPKLPFSDPANTPSKHTAVINGNYPHTASTNGYIPYIPKPPVDSRLAQPPKAIRAVEPATKPTQDPHKKEIISEETPKVSKDKEKVLKLYWKWPIQGKLIKNFVQTGNKGVDIEGTPGEPVQAAATGEVVYSGNGLIGYGNLLIIKHDDVHLSAYRE